MDYHGWYGDWCSGIERLAVTANLPLGSPKSDVTSPSRMVFVLLQLKRRIDLDSLFGLLEISHSDQPDIKGVAKGSIL